MQYKKGMQALLFDAPVPHAQSVAPRRVVPAPGSWVDHQPGWLQGQSALFATLQREVRWREAERPMYDRVVAVPRLLATLPEDADPALVRPYAASLSAHYGRDLSFVHMALYRDGRDSVAMHADHVGGRRHDSVVAIVSLGEPRPFHLRPVDGGPLRTWRLGWGDLLVLGGRIQADFHHGVPKVASALPRLSIMFRDGGRTPPR